MFRRQEQNRNIVKVELRWQSANYPAVLRSSCALDRTSATCIHIAICLMVWYGLTRAGCI